MACTKRSHRSYGTGEWGRNRVPVFPEPKTGLFQVEWRDNGRRLTRSLLGSRALPRSAALRGGQWLVLTQMLGLSWMPECAGWPTPEASQAQALVRGSPGQYSSSGPIREWMSRPHPFRNMPLGALVDRFLHISAEVSCNEPTTSRLSQVGSALRSGSKHDWPGGRC